jgi:hypothetical protein
LISEPGFALQQMIVFRQGHGVAQGHAS